MWPKEEGLEEEYLCSAEPQPNGVLMMGIRDDEEKVPRRFTAVGILS